MQVSSIHIHLLNRIILAGIVTLLCSMLVFFDAFAQTDEKSVEQTQDVNMQSTSWIKNCVRESEKRISCITSQKLFLENGQQLVALAVRSIANEKQSLIIAKVPVGIKVEPGIELEIAGETLKLEYDVCINDGCQADKEVDNAVIEKMFKAENTNILYILFNGQRVRINIPLESFQDAYNGEPQSLRNTVKVKKN